jgi:hypothetical protein
MYTMSWRFFFLGFSASVVTAVNAASPLEYIGQQIVPTGTMQFNTTIGGLSGIDYDPASGRYFAVSDDASQINPARFYDLSLNLAQFHRSNAPGSSGVSFNSVRSILTPGGSTFGARQLDPEAIRFDGTHLYWSSEGARRTNDFQDPFVRRMTVLGEHTSELNTPARFKPSGSVAGTQPGDSGARNSFGFESLALSPNRDRIYTANANALVQDGPATAIGQSSVSRLIEFNVTTGNAMAEFAYVVEPLVQEPSPPTAYASNNLTELLSIGDRQFIALELSFSSGEESTVRLYYADARNATDISTLDSLDGAAFTPMAKTLLLDLADLRNDDGSPIVVDAIEGITFGPMHEGRPTFVLVSDDNFSNGQFTQFIALSRIAPIPEPEIYAQMSISLLLMLVARRCIRRRGRPYHQTA